MDEYLENTGDFNYAWIIFGDEKIDGFVDLYEYCTDSNTVELIIEGVPYKVPVNCVLLTRQE